MAIYLDQLHTASEVFYNFALGSAAVVGTVFGSFEIKRRLRIAYLRRMFTLSQLGKDFEIVDTDAEPGKLFILHFPTKKRYWIRNYATYTDLGFVGQPRHRVTQRKFNNYRNGKTIVLTRGNPGT